MKTYLKEHWKNILLLYCGIYTVVTVLNSVAYLLNGIYEDPSGNWHELSRAVIVFIGVLVIQLEKNVRIKNVLLKELIIYIPAMLLVFGYVWLDGLREPLASNAYSGIFVIFTSSWICYSLIMFALRFMRQRMNNK
ncbi:MAG: DUF6608 family protein [Cellulosilyticaceae bacterium]